MCVHTRYVCTSPEVLRASPLLSFIFFSKDAFLFSRSRKSKDKRYEKVTKKTSTITSVWYIDAKRHYRRILQGNVRTRGLMGAEPVRWKGLRKQKRTPCSGFSFSSLGRMSDCVGVRELVHQLQPWSALICPAWTHGSPSTTDLSHMIEAAGNGNSQCNLTSHTRRIH